MPRLALRRLKLHQDRGEPLREVVVDVARQPVALFEDRLAPLFDRRLSSIEPAVMQRQRRLPRDRFDQHDAPPLALGLRRDSGWRPSSSRGCGCRARAAWRRSRPQSISQAEGPESARAAAHRRRRTRRSRSSPACTRTGAPPCSRTGTLAESRRAVSQSSFGGVNSRSFTYAIHSSHRWPSSSISHTRAGVALALLDHRLGQRAEEAFDVRLAHQQIERELDDLGLHVRAALGAAALAGLAHQRGAQHLRIVRRDFLRLLTCTRPLSHLESSTSTSLRLSGSLRPIDAISQHVLMADAGIVQKDEIASSTRRGSAVSRASASRRSRSCPIVATRHASAKVGTVQTAQEVSHDTLDRSDLIAAVGFGGASTGATRRNRRQVLARSSSPSFPAARTFFTEGKDTERSELRQLRPRRRRRGQLQPLRRRRRRSQRRARRLAGSAVRRACTSNTKTPNLLNYSGNLVVSAANRSSVVPYVTGGVGGLSAVRESQPRHQRHRNVPDRQRRRRRQVVRRPLGPARRLPLHRGASRRTTRRPSSGSETRYGHRVYGGVLLNVASLNRLDSRHEDREAAWRNE